MAAGDQLFGVAELPRQGVVMGLVGDEDRAGQAGVALVAGLQRRQQAPAVGQEAVGSVEQVQAVVVLAGELHLGAVGLELGGGQERLLGVFLALGDVVHRHRRCGVPGVALQDVDGQAELGEPGQLGVPEPVGVAQLQPPALAVGDLDDVAELTQHPAVGARRVGLVAAPVAGALQEQEPRLQLGKAGRGPRLLFLDDRGDLAVDQDAVRRDVDLALGVAEPDDLLALGGLDGPLGRRGEAVELAGADLAGAAAGEDLQQDHPHRLRVVEAVGEDLRAVAAGDGHLLGRGQARAAAARRGSARGRGRRCSAGR